MTIFEGINLVLILVLGAVLIVCSRTMVNLSHKLDRQETEPKAAKPNKTSSGGLQEVKKTRRVITSGGVFTYKEKRTPKTWTEQDLWVIEQENK